MFLTYPGTCLFSPYIQNIHHRTVFGIKLYLLQLIPVLDLPYSYTLCWGKINHGYWAYLWYDISGGLMILKHCWFNIGWENKLCARGYVKNCDCALGGSQLFILGNLLGIEATNFTNPKLWGIKNYIICNSKRYSFIFNTNDLIL